MSEVGTSTTSLTWLSELDANALLRPLALKLGGWNEITPTDPAIALSWSKRRAPRDGLALFSFADYVCGWLPSGAWKLVQFTNSTGFGVTGASFFSKLCPPGMPLHSFTSGGLRPIKVSIAESGRERTLGELAIVNIAFALLLLEQHAYIVSEGSARRQMIGLFDGFAYLSSDANSNQEPETYFVEFEQNRVGAMDWLADGLAAFDD